MNLDGELRMGVNNNNEGALAQAAGEERQDLQQPYA
jgi:hypothetical protein